MLFLNFCIFNILNLPKLKRTFKSTIYTGNKQSWDWWVSALGSYFSITINSSSTCRRTSVKSIFCYVETNYFLCNSGSLSQVTQGLRIAFILRRYTYYCWSQKFKNDFYFSGHFTYSWNHSRILKKITWWWVWSRDRKSCYQKLPQGALFQPIPRKKDANSHYYKCIVQPLLCSINCGEVLVAVVAVVSWNPIFCVQCTT